MSISEAKKRGGPPKNLPSSIGKIPEITEEEKRRASLSCAESAEKNGWLTDLPEVLGMLGLSA